MEPVYNIRNKISVKKKLNFYFISLWYNTHGHIRGLAAYSVYLLFSQQILRFAGIACSYHALWKKISASQLLSSPANMVYCKKEKSEGNRKGGRAMKLLVIEDEWMLCDTIAKSLHHAGYEVDCCYDGAEALERLLIEQYDLIVLDLHLPR